VVNKKSVSSPKRNQPTEAPTPIAEAESAVVLRSHEDLDATPEEKRRAADLQRQAAAEEQQVSSQVRGLQALMQKEEQALAQRLAYAAQMRAQGLTENDQKLLNQAEAIERQALDYYQRRVKQFENTRVTNGSSNARVRQPVQQTQPRAEQPTRSPRPATQYQRSHSTYRYRSWR
jgi:hypothetical protein